VPHDRSTQPAVEAPPQGIVKCVVTRESSCLARPRALGRRRQERGGRSHRSRTTSGTPPTAVEMTGVPTRKRLDSCIAGGSPRRSRERLRARQASCREHSREGRLPSKPDPIVKDDATDTTLDATHAPARTPTRTSAPAHLCLARGGECDRRGFCSVQRPRRQRYRRRASAGSTSVGRRRRIVSNSIRARSSPNPLHSPRGLPARTTMRLAAGEQTVRRRFKGPSPKER